MPAEDWQVAQGTLLLISVIFFSELNELLCLRPGDLELGVIKNQGCCLYVFLNMKGPRSLCSH